MAWDDSAKLLAIKAIGTVESNMKYDAINYRDPITVGIMQWYATRAATLLNKLRATSAWVGVAPTLTASLASYAETNGGYWTTRYLRQDEGESLQPVLTSQTGVQIQNAQTIEDLEDYRVAAEKLELSADVNTNAFIFFCVMYHQSPRYARDILRVAGVAPTMDRLHSLALNHHWFSGYKTRFNTARNIIASGDSSGVPDWGVDPEYPDEGTDPGTTPGVGNPSEPGSRDLGNLSHIELVGDSLHVRIGGKTVIAYPTNTGTMWRPGIEGQPGTGPVIPPPTTPNPNPEVPPGDPTLQGRLVQWMTDRISQFNYSQTNPGRNNPDVSGFGDCSSTVRRAYRDLAGIEVGTYTVDQHKNYGRRVWSNMPGAGNARGSIPPANLLRPGDLMFFCRHQTFDRVHHVEMVMTDTNKLIGHGGPRWADVGPNIKSGSYADYINRNNYGFVEVRRYV